MAPALLRSLAVLLASLPLLPGAWPRPPTGLRPPTHLAMPAPPPVSAAALYAVDLGAGRPLYARRADVRRAPASLAKLATALVVITHAALADRVAIDASDVVDPRVYSHMGLVAGDTLTVEQLLYGLLLPSGDDAALALARAVGRTLPGGDPAHGGDPRAAFVVALNTLAARLGLHATRFVNPTGVDVPGQVSTARELAALAAAVLRQPTLALIVQAARVELTSVGPAPRIYVLTNTNPFAGQPGTLGVKTGTTPAAGGCLIVAARFHQTNTVLLVLLGSRVVRDAAGAVVGDRRAADADAVFAALARDYRWRSPTVPGEVPGLAALLAGHGVRVRAGPALVVPAVDWPWLRCRVEVRGRQLPDGRVGQVVCGVGAIALAGWPVYPVWHAASARGGSPARPILTGNSGPRAPRRPCLRCHARG